MNILFCGITEKRAWLSEEFAVLKVEALLGVLQPLRVPR
jgi:hypothetical protein